MPTHVRTPTVWLVIACLSLALPTISVAQLSPPTIVQALQRDNGGTAIRFVPETGAVTPTANALVILHCHWGSSSNTNISSVSQPTWAMQGWTLAAASSGTGNRFSKVAAYWTITKAVRSADKVTVTLSDPNNWGIGCGLVEYASGYSASAPIAQSEAVSSAWLAGGTAIRDNLPSAPVSTSRLLMLGKAQQANVYAFSDVVSGWTKHMPAEEGGGQVSFVATANGSNGTSYGGDFGGSSPAHDQVNGAVYLALEIRGALETQAAGGSALLSSNTWLRSASPSTAIAK